MGINAGPRACCSHRAAGRIKPEGLKSPADEDSVAGQIDQQGTRPTGRKKERNAKVMGPNAVANMRRTPTTGRILQSDAFAKCKHSD